MSLLYIFKSIKSADNKYDPASYKLALKLKDGRHWGFGMYLRNHRLNIKYHYVLGWLSRDYEESKTFFSFDWAKGQ